MACALSPQVFLAIVEEHLVLLVCKVGGTSGHPELKEGRMSLVIRVENKGKRME